MADNTIRDQLVGELTNTFRNHGFIWNGYADGMFCSGCLVPRTTPKSEYDHGDYEMRRFEDYEAYARHLGELAGVLMPGWRPPARTIGTAEELDTLSWPCVIREIPAEPLKEFHPQIWEMGRQIGWCRAGVEYRAYDSSPRLPVEVLVEPPEVTR